MNKAVQKVTEHLFWKSVAFAVLVAGLTSAALETLRVAPLKERVEFLENEIAVLRDDGSVKASLKHNAMQKESEHIVSSGINNTREYLLSRPKNIVAALSDMSSRDALAFQQKTYFDKWMHIEGPVYDVIEVGNVGSLQFIVDGQQTDFLVNSNQLTKLANIHRGDKVTAEGKFTFANPQWVEFEDAEIFP